jgi:hypothetical protein
MNENDRQDTTPGASTPRPRTSSTAWPFALLLGVVLVYWLSFGRNGLMEGWTNQFEPALAKAAEVKQPVLVYFSVPG